MRRTRSQGLQRMPVLLSWTSWQYRISQGNWHPNLPLPERPLRVGWQAWKLLRERKSTLHWNDPFLWLNNPGPLVKIWHCRLQVQVQWCRSMRCNSMMWLSMIWCLQILFRGASWSPDAETNARIVVSEQLIPDPPDWSHKCSLFVRRKRVEARSCNSTHFLRIWWRRQPGQPSLKKRDAEVPKKLSGLAAVVLEK